MLNNVQDLLTVFDIGDPDYEVLEYIELDGTQYFDTGYYGTLNTKLEAGISFTNLDTHMMVFGARNGGATGTSNMSCLAAFGYTSATEKLLAVDFNNESALTNYRLQVSPSNLIINTFYDIITCRDFRSVSLDGSYITPKSGNTNPQTTNATTAFSSQYTITVGTVNGASFGGTSYYNLSGRVRYFRIFENEVLVHDYVPALDKNGKPCLYDRKNQNAIYAYKLSDGTDATDTLQYKRWINKQEVEYIESTGTQYIDTGYKFTNKSAFEITCAEVAAFEASTVLCGARNNTDTTTNARIVDYSYSAPSVLRGEYLLLQRGGYDVNENVIYIPYDTEFHTYYQSPTRMSIDGTERPTVPSLVSPNMNFYIFWQNVGTATAPAKAKIKVKNCKLWDNEMLVRDLQPIVYQGVACMYDKVYNKIYTNIGTGAFKHGPFTKEDTNKYEVLKYLQTDGTQYYKTGETLSSTDRVEFRASTSGTALNPSTGQQGSAYFFGVYESNKFFGINKAITGVTYVVWQNSNSISFTHSLEYNTFYDVSVSSDGVYVDGVKEASVSGSFTGSNECYISWANGTSQPVAKIKLACLKIYKSGVLIKDYIPVLDETFTPCLYDRANRVFLYHTNTEGSTTIPSYEAWNKKNVYYLEGSGTQYIDTGVVGTQNTKAELVIKATSINNKIFGARTGTSENNISVFFGTAGSPKLGIDFTNSDYSTYRCQYDTLNIKAKVTLGKTERTIENMNGAILESNTNVCPDTITTSETLRLFDIANGFQESLFVGEFYSCKIWDNAILIRDFQPVVVQGTACMYDSAYNKAYTNAGTGVFIAGPDVDEPEERYEVLEYIQLDGTQYFDTELPTADGMSFEAGFVFTGTSSVSNGLFGGRHDTGRRVGDKTVWTGYELRRVGSSTYTQTINQTQLGQVTSSQDIAIGTYYDMYFSGTSLKLNNTTLTIEQGTSIETPMSIYIGAINNDGSAAVPISGKIHYFKIYNSTGKFIRDYIPVLDSDGLPCLYDRVTETFLYAKKISDGTDASATLGYQRWNKYEVDYIESTGTQYIDTGYKPTKNMSFDLYGIDMDYASGTTRFGSRTGTSSETFVLATITDNHFRWSYGTSSSPSTSDNVFNTQKKAKQISWDATTKKCTITFIDNTTETSVQMSGTDLTSNAVPVYLFAFSNNGEAICATVKHTRIVFREGGTLIRDFKPVVWNSSSGTQACMYDEVYNKMYTNAGTGAFKASIISKVNGTLADIEVGASLTPVRTSANPPAPACPYIMTDIIPNDSVGCEFIFSVTVNNKGNYVIASRGDNTGRFYLYSNEGSTNIKYGWGTFETTSTATTVNHKYVMSLNKFMDKRFIVDDTKLVDLPPVDFSGNTFPLVMFANNTNGTVASSEITGLHGNFYYGIITLFNKVIREYIPARYNNTVGILERKTGRFLTNGSNVGSFTFNEFS